MDQLPHSFLSGAVKAIAYPSTSQHSISFLGWHVLDDTFKLGPESALARRIMLRRDLDHLRQLAWWYFKAFCFQIESANKAAFHKGLKAIKREPVAGLVFLWAACDPERQSRGDWQVADKDRLAHLGFRLIWFLVNTFSTQSIHVLLGFDVHMFSEKPINLL